jgi:hypothetical protein
MWDTRRQVSKMLSKLYAENRLVKIIFENRKQVHCI